MISKFGLCEGAHVMFRCSTVCPKSSRERLKTLERLGILKFSFFCLHLKIRRGLWKIDWRCQSPGLTSINCDLWKIFFVSRKTLVGKVTSFWLDIRNQYWISCGTGISVFCNTFFLVVCVFYIKLKGFWCKRALQSIDNGQWSHTFSEHILLNVITRSFQRHTTHCILQNIIEWVCILVMIICMYYVRTYRAS